MKRSLLTVASFSSLVAVAQTERPNIMIIMVDDMGYSDAGCYGGEINTPNIDSLASTGLRFTQFYNGSRSCPSRASLMTGLFPQQAGITSMGNSLNNNCVTIPEVLKNYGYNTAMTGKWHLSLTQAQSTYNAQMQWLAHRADYGSFAPLASYPCNRGFDEHYGIIWGVADYFDPFSLVHNEEPIDTVPTNFYMTDYVTDKTVDLIDSLSKKDDPYFMYVAYTAPHWPLHAKPEDIAKYKGKYDEGWDVLRQKRYDRMIELGLIDPNKVPFANNESNRKWIDETYKSWESENMEVHAAMVDCLDQGVGKIIAKLKETGDYDNTIIFFLSDNGASYERYTASGFDRPSITRSGETIHYPAERPTPGVETSMGYIGTGWAGAVNTPFRYWKSESFHGGNATPLIVHWPAGLKTAKGTITSQPGHIIDIMPTCLELAEATYPTTFKDSTIIPLESASLKPILEGNIRPQPEAMYWEHEGGRAVRVGDWKLVSLKNANWQLFDLSTDLNETNDIAVDYPGKVKELKTLWNAWAVRMGLTVPEEVEDTPLELVCYYPFNDNLQDNSGNNYALSNPNSAGFSEGKFGKAIELNGTNQYLDMTTSDLINPASTPYSACAWIYNTATTIPTTGNLYEEVILAQKDGAADAAGRIALYTRYDGTTAYFNNFLGGYANLSTRNAFKRNEWMHVAVICNPATLEVSYYINGVKDTTVNASAAFESCTGAFRIGGHKANKNYWHGKIDELYLFKGILSTEDINKVMNNTYFTTENITVNDKGYSLNAYYDAFNKVIRVYGLFPVKTINLYNTNGSLIANTRNNNLISTRNLSAGTYIVQLEDTNGNKRSKNLIIQ